MRLELLGLTLVIFLMTGALAWSQQRLQGRISAQARQLQRSAALQTEIRWWQSALDRLAQWQEVTESTIDGGAQAVRAMHQGIAAIPFGILEAIPATRDTSRVVRSVHDFTADNVYAAIAAVNRLAGSGSRRWIKRPDRKASPAEPAPPQAEPSDHNKA